MVLIDGIKIGYVGVVSDDTKVTDIFPVLKAEH